MEAPLKFSAPGITIPLGLGIGQLVFHMLNRVEIVLCVIMAITLFVPGRPGRTTLILFGIAAASLIVQTFGLYPLLDKRAEAVISGAAAPFSGVHVIYGATEVIKMIALAALGATTARRALRASEQTRI